MKNMDRLFGSLKNYDKSTRIKYSIADPTIAAGPNKLFDLVTRIINYIFVFI